MSNGSVIRSGDQKGGGTVPDAQGRWDMQAREQKGELAFFRLPISSIYRGEIAADSLSVSAGENLG
jgi:hypothetical protein